MADARPSVAAEYRDWSVAAVRLLQGVVYNDDAKVWEILQRSQEPLAHYFSRLALLLVVDEAEGYAYLRQWHETEYPADYEAVPKLVRRTPLAYGPTLLCVLLREELRRYEEDDVHNERCVAESTTLFDQWKLFFPVASDEVKQLKEFTAALRKVEEMGFIRKFLDEPESWEVRRILKARLSAAELEALRLQLLAHQAGVQVPGGEQPIAGGEHHE